MTHPRPLPLSGVEVVSVEQAVAAPYAGSRLADAGAHVVKIERPGGDFARGYDAAAAGQSSYFVWLNRGKESVTLDLATPAGKAELAGRIAKADVLLSNLKTGAMEKLGFGAEALAEKHPRLIQCAISGYGETGPMADRKAYDLLIQAESGLCSLTGGPEGPARVGISIVDIATGAAAYQAILEALLRRAQDGKGAVISISMFDVTAEWCTVPLLNHEAGASPQRIGLAHPSISPYGAFETRDGKLVLISVQSDREWRALAASLLGDAGLGTDPRFATNVARVQNRPLTDAAVAAAFAAHDAEEAIAVLLKAGIALASVNDMEGLSAHPHLRRIAVETPQGTVRLPAPPAIFDGRERDYGPVPALNPLDETV